MVKFVEHLQALLQSVSQAKDEPISELNALPDAERALLLEQWSGAERYREDIAGLPSGCLHSLIEQQVQKTPQSKALTYGQSHLTYAELWKQATDAAIVLQSHGIKVGSMVALMVDRSFEMVIGMLAILQAGGAYAPFAPKMPQDRLLFMAKDCHTAVVLTTQEHMQLAQSIGVSTVLRLGTDDVVPQSGAALSAVAVSQKDALLCLYTSGSTGKPKAVLLSHAAVLSHLWYAVTDYSFSAQDTYLQSISYTFVASIPEIFSMLLVGGTVSLAAPDALMFMDSLAKHIRDERVTLAQFIPSVMGSFIENEKLSETVRCLVLTGEPLPVSLLERVMAMSPKLQILNHYGCTEVTDTTTVAKFSRKLTTQLKNIPVGKPVRYRVVLVLDSERRPVPLGVPGELYASGVGMATEYLNQPELTAKMFVPNVCGYDRAYATGDLVRWKANGDMECLGRIDLQVKVNGLRIELGEIEGVLQNRPEVQEAVVLLQDKLLIGYASPPPADGGAQLLAHCRLHLPGYMVPATVIGMAEWPRNANGKLDRRALPKFELPKKAARKKDVVKTDEPIATAESLVYSIMSDVLETDVSSSEDNIFLLGGTSLSVARITSELRKTSPGLTLRDVYSGPTAGSIVNFIQADFDEKQGSAAIETSRTVRWRHQLRKLGWTAFAIMALMDAAVTAIVYMLPWLWLFWMVNLYSPYEPHSGENEFDLSTMLHPNLETGLILSGFILIAQFVPGFTFLMLHIVGKWAFIGRYRQGVYPVYGTYYMRWWLVHRMQVKARFGHYWLSTMARTPMLVTYMRVLGARVGRNVFIDGMVVGDGVSMPEPDLVFLGDNVTLNSQANVLTHYIREGFITLKGTTLNNHSQVGSRGVLMPGSVLGVNTTLCEHSILQEDQLAPSDTIWKGSPAQPAAQSYYDPYLESLKPSESRKPSTRMKRDMNAPRPNLAKYLLVEEQQPRRRRRKQSIQKRQAERAKLPNVSGFQKSYGKSLAQGLLILTVLPALKFSLQLPAVAVFLAILDGNGWVWAIAPEDINESGSGMTGVYLLPLGFLVWASTLVIVIPIYKKLLMPAGLSPGLYPLNSWKFIHVWVYTRIMSFADPIMDFLYGTMFIPMWVNLLGGDMPMSAELAAHVNTLNFIPELVEFKNDSFVASHVDLGTMVVNRGQLIVSKITLGEQSMLGNHSWVTPGTVTGSGSLIGAYTVNQDTVVPDDSTWFGSPAIELPKRFRHEASDIAYQPTVCMKIGRGLSEMIESVIDAALFATVHFFYHGITCMTVLLYFPKAYWFPMLLTVPIGQWCLSLIIHQLGHWLLVPGSGSTRYLPLWGLRLNLIMMFKRLEDVLVRDFVAQFSGTPYAGTTFRLLGAKIGKHCFFHGSWCCEWDMLTIGDNVSITYSDLQTHLFEDRVFKCNPIRIGEHTTIMPFSLVLPNAVVEAGCEIGPKSCVMQGETLPPNTRWQGAPLELVRPSKNGERKAKFVQVARRKVRFPLPMPEEELRKIHSETVQ